MVTSISAPFADRVMNRAFAKHSIVHLSASAQPVVEASGHPLFSDLAVGESRDCEMVSLFIDLTDFTGRTFWDDPELTAELAHGALSGFSYAVTMLGGHVLGLRGDGLFAGFGPSQDPKISAAAALATAAASLDAIESTVNPRLKLRGVHPIQARAGIDFGKTTFTRSGTADVNEVNAIGFATNFAAKCEKRAKSWEVVVGEGLYDSLDPADLMNEHEKSPKVFQRDLERRYYKFFDVRWRRVVPQVNSAIAEVAGRSLVGASF